MPSVDKAHENRPWVSHYPSGVSATLEYPEIPLHEVLRRTATTRRNQDALIFFGKSTSYGALFDEVKRVASGLLSLGLKKGDRVAIMLPNCPQVVASYYGVLWAGGVVVMVNPLYSARELNFQLNDSGARFLIVLDLLYQRAAQAIEGTRVEKTIVTGIQDRLRFPLNVAYTVKMKREGKLPKIPGDPKIVRYAHLLTSEPMEQPASTDPKDDLALLQYTGGTTGTPKGVMLTHSNLLANCMQIQAWVPPMGADPITIMGVLPFFHAYGMTTVMNYGVMAGARIVLFPRFETARVLKAVEKHRPQLFPGVPTMYVAINNYSGVDRFDLKSIQWCISGAAPLSLEVKETFERLTSGKLVEGYGLTEASPVTHSNPLNGVQKVGSIGLPLPDTDCRVVDLTTGESLPSDQVGELVISGPQVMQGYWKHYQETANVLKDGWLYTGDIGRMDADGYFYIVGRKKEMVIVSGFNVYPSEVEEVLTQHPAVFEAAVIGVPHPYQGEAVKAFVVRKKDAECSPEELMQFCREYMASYKVPKEIEFVEELPKSMIGKVLRRVLAERDHVKSFQTPAEAEEPVKKHGG